MTEPEAEILELSRISMFTWPTSVTCMLIKSSQVYGNLGIGHIQSLVKSMY